LRLLGGRQRLPFQDLSAFLEQVEKQGQVALNIAGKQEVRANVLMALLADLTEILYQSK
jgi:hypothetical protein